MLDDRKAAILRAIVEGYVTTAQPIGSRHVLDHAGISVSSATVRNDMVALEREGFLEQPHTSAGRVPTDKGYRFFVDQLEEPGLNSLEAETVRAFFDKSHARVEQLLQDTSRLLSSLTNYAAVVAAPTQEAAVIRAVQVVRLQPTMVLVLVVLADGNVDRITIEIRDDLSDVAINAATARLTALLDNQVAARAAQPTPTGDASVDNLVREVIDRISEVDEEEAGPVFVRGAAAMAAAFDATEQVRAVLSVLEEQFVVVTLLRDILGRGMQVSIGTETGVETLMECSLVVAPYHVDGQAAGTIGVLGPTRMNYPQALAAVAVVSRQLGERLTQG